MCRYGLRTELSFKRGEIRYNKTIDVYHIFLGDELDSFYQCYTKEHAEQISKELLLSN